MREFKYSENVKRLHEMASEMMTKIVFMLLSTTFYCSF